MFNGITLSDYFYAAALQPRVNYATSPPTLEPNIGVISVQRVKASVNMTTANPIVSQRYDINFGVFVGGELFPALTLTEEGYFTFAPNQTIISVDATVLNLGISSNGLLNNKTAFVENFCTEYFLICNTTTDPLGYYGTMTNCMNTMLNASLTRQTEPTSNLPVNWALPQGNTYICRQIHLNVGWARPFTHCPHSGSTGGGACVDPPYYLSYYSQEF